MKICLYSTQVFPSNPDVDTYAGLELVVGLLAKYFDEKGHDVSLFACKNSYFSTDKDGKKQGSDRSHLYAIGDKGTDPVLAWKTYWDDPNTRKILKEANIICDHSWNWYPYSVHKELKNLCHVNHGPSPSFENKPPIEKPNLIGVGFNHAKWMMKMAQGTNWRAVQNGIPLYKYTMNNKPIAERERLLWLSRIYYPKGAHRAIDIANTLKMPIDIAGGSFGQVPAYVDQIKKACADSPYATYHGPIDFKKKLELYQNAKCVILPIIEYGLQNEQGQPWEWHEPLGLIAPECNASGTPIIVTPNGGWNETMIHGLNGFFANTNKEFEQFVRQVDSLKPEDCRKMAERFDYKIMGENYLKLFNEILEGKSW